MLDSVFPLSRLLTVNVILILIGIHVVTKSVKPTAFPTKRVETFQLGIPVDLKTYYHNAKKYTSKGELSKKYHIIASYGCQGDFDLFPQYQYFKKDRV